MAETAARCYEVQKYMCLDGHTYGAESILINLDYYNNLPAEIQTAIDEAAAYAGEQHLELAMEGMGFS